MGNLDEIKAGDVKWLSMKGEGLSVYVKGFANKIGEFFFLKVLQSKKNTYFCNPKSCESSSVGRARPCQG
ncbi:MAG TPA: hypothetical protein VLB84_20050, partial [Bacteroidia bacterium]|nr:hypothetical protein [Bacteroidia bacterium]